MTKSPKLLLHVCCANCALAPIDLLKSDFEIILFWYNPNIKPISEHEKRLNDFRILRKTYQFHSIENLDDQQLWLDYTKDLSNEPEGGQRCNVCFQMRLEKTAQMAQQNNCQYFTTTLGISRYKNTELIDSLGHKLAQKYQIKYYPIKLDKNWAAQQELKLSKHYGFYRQKYCGCLYK